MKNRLFVDTCLNQLTLVLQIDESKFDKVILTSKNQVAEMLIPSIKSLLERNGFKFNQIVEIYITYGPGSYTGERLGLTFAKIYSLLNKDVKIYTISTLQAMMIDDSISICLIDARNDASFTGVYQLGNPIQKDARLEKNEVESLIEKYPNAKLLCLDSQKEIFSSRFNKEVIGIDYSTSLIKNAKYFKLVTNPIDLKPIYLRGKNGY